MSHTTVTHRPDSMPKQTGLMYREGRYYFNARVPKDLREVYGKSQIRKSLETSSYTEAVKLVKLEAVRHELDFAEKRRAKIPECKASLPVVERMTPQEALDRVKLYLIQEDREAQDRWEAERGTWTEQELRDAAEDTMMDIASTANPHAFAAPELNPLCIEDHEAENVNSVLEPQGVHVTKNSEAHRLLRPLLTRADLEFLLRRLDRLQNNGQTQTHDPAFADAHFYSSPPQIACTVTVGEMLIQFEQHLKDGNRRGGTIRTYQAPINILKGYFGPDRSLGSISQDDCEALFKLLLKAPANASQRYPGMDLKQAVAAADRCNDPKRLSGKTLENYHTNIVAIFNFAVKRKRWITESPAGDPWFRELMTSKGGSKPKVLFTTDELNRLFRAPLYTGCKNDELGFAREGNQHPRRGRFWIPLLSLFQGFRANEVVQLFTEDVGEEDGIPYLHIREELDHSEDSTKLLKTGQSKRKIPIHSEILKMGFMDFVNSRRDDKREPRLFPELPLGKSGYYSDPFSKWFARFVDSALGNECGATLHSFRHQFKDALVEGNLEDSWIDRLGGWLEERGNSSRLYGKGPSISLLREKLESAKFPPVDLSHLYARKRPRPRPRI